MEQIQIIVVDDSNTIRDSLQSYAKAKKWYFVESNGTEVPLEVRDDLPTLILLDYNLDKGIKPEVWLQQFKDKYYHLKYIVYILSGDYPQQDKLTKFADKHKLAGILGKPLDPRRLPELLKHLEDSYVKTPTPLTESEIKQAIEERDIPIRLLDKRTLQPVYENSTARQHPLDNGGYKKVQAIVSKLIAKKKNRLVDLEWDANYNGWLRRTLSEAGSWYWLKEVKTPRYPNLDPNLAVLFRTQDQEEQLEILANILKQEWGITRVRCYRVSKLFHIRNKYLVQPLWQRGDGFSENLSEEEWKKHHFSLDENDKAQQAFDSGLPYLRCGFSQREIIYKIEWGDAKTCIKIPIWDSCSNQTKEYTDKSKDESPLGMICIDRRNDHIRDHWIEDDPKNTEITEGEMKHIEKLLVAVQPMLKNYIQNYQANWKQKWRKQLDGIVAEGLQKDKAKSALEYAFSQISDKWQAHNKKPQDIYMILLREDNLLESWVGVGEVFEKQKGQLFELESPFKEALQDTHIIHDFQKNLFLKKLALKGIGSWLGIPLKQGERTFGILVITLEKKYSFTNTMVNSLEATASRIMPILLWGLSQAKQEWLIRALAHEYREPVNRLTNLTENLPSKEKKEAQALLEYQSSIVLNLRILAGTSKITSSNQGNTYLYEVCKDVINVVNSLYNNVKIEYTKNSKLSSVSIPRAVMYQILFNLIENACKFNLPDKPVKVYSEIVDQQLLINICNHCVEPIPEYDLKRIFLPFERGSEAPQAKGAGIGLAVAKKLANKFNLDLQLEQIKNKNVTLICFILKFSKRN
jgi:signal transduction histidine kinase/CheY-like chemotaxis protein